MGYNRRSKVCEHLLYIFRWRKLMSRKTPEGKLKAELIRDIEDLFPGCYILFNDSLYLQGIPDILILFEDRWAMLEVKKSATASRQPNQEYYIEVFNDMSFAAFVYPENKEEVLGALQSTFRSSRQARVPKR